MFGCKHPHVYEELLACLYSDLRKLLKHEICTGLYLRNFPPGCSGIFLYFLLMMRMLTISIKSKDDYGSLVVIGVVFMFAFQIFENIGMTMGIMPVTGVTLPFLSYGGSSLITSLLAIGLVLNVYMRRMRGSFLYMD